MVRKIRFGILVVLLLLGATSLIANPDYEIYYDYYTDATLTTHCGYWYITCTGMIRGGCQTEYATMETGPECTDPEHCEWIGGQLVCW